MKILVVDDSRENRLLLDKLLTGMGHDIVLAEDGQQAIDWFISANPDLILMDVLMPIMNGLDAIRAIRALPMERWVSIMVVSALADDQDIINGLKAGADDYILKPFSKAILTAKLNSIQRSVEMQSVIAEKNRQLETYQAQNEAERLFLRSIFERLIKQNHLKDDHLQFWLQPVDCFSGDLLCVKRVSPQQIYFLLADSTGHGLAAAIPTVIVNQAFQAMTQKMLPIAVIVREINRLLHDQMPTGRFVALALGMIDADRNSIDLWNGGLPEVLVLDQTGNVAHAFHSRHPAAGILQDSDFDHSWEHWVWQDACELFAYSDGLTESCDPNDQLFGQEQLLHTLRLAANGNRITAVQDALILHVANRQFQDDISCMSIRCP